MNRVQIERRFACLHDSVVKVMASCVTEPQLTAAYMWGMNITDQLYFFLAQTIRRRNQSYADRCRRQVTHSINELYFTRITSGTVYSVRLL